MNKLILGIVFVLIIGGGYLFVNKKSSESNLPFDIEIPAGWEERKINNADELGIIVSYLHDYQPGVSPGGVLEVERVEYSSLNKSSNRIESGPIVVGSYDGEYQISSAEGRFTSGDGKNNFQITFVTVRALVTVNDVNYLITHRIPESYYSVNKNEILSRIKSIRFR